jgi:molybdopterin synthase sulfur carrier subunit
MSTIAVKYRGQLAKLTGTAEETARVNSVAEALRFIREAHGADAEKNAKTMLIAVNGESILLRKLFKTALKDGDVLSFFPICGGG